MSGLALQGRHVLVSGESGIGKSVLLDSLCSRLSGREDIQVFRIHDARQFKPALLDLAAQLHCRRLLQHPNAASGSVEGQPWDKVAARFRALPAGALAEAIRQGLAACRSLLIWDHFDSATPAQLSCLHQFLHATTVILATSKPDTPKLKVIFDRIPGRVRLPALSREESFRLIDLCLQVAPLPLSSPGWYRQEIWRHTRGNPRALKDLLADHATAELIDGAFIRGIGTEQGARYWPVSWLLLVGGLLFSIHRYVGRGLGDRDAYIVGAVGMVIFLFLAMLVRKANRP